MEKWAKTKFFCFIFHMVSSAFPTPLPAIAGVLRSELRGSVCVSPPGLQQGYHSNAPLGLTARGTSDKSPC